MWNQFILGACILFLALILVGLFRRKLYRYYPAFTMYISFVLITDIILYPIYTSWRSAYANFYWASEFLHLALGCLVLWEIYERMLADYRGVLRLVRIVFPLVLLTIAGRIAFYVWNGSGAALFSSPTLRLLERDVRLFQVALIFVIVALLAYYAIPVNKHLRGILLGYGFYVATDMIALTYTSHGRLASAQSTGIFLWPYVSPIAYLLSEWIWFGTFCINKVPVGERIPVRPHAEPRTAVEPQPAEQAVH